MAQSRWVIEEPEAPAAAAPTSRFVVEPPAPAATPAPEPSLISSLVRPANVLGHGLAKGYAGLVDLPIGLLNLLIQGGAAPFGGTGFTLPGTGGAGQALEAYAQSTGFEPESTPGERVISRVGQELAGASATAATGAGLASRLPAALKPFLTSGRFLGTDIPMAIGSGTGAGIAQEAYPGSPTAELLSQIGGGVATQLPQLIARDTVLRGILRGIGAQKLTPEQEVLQQQFRDVGVDPLASDVTGRRGVARIESIPQQFPIGVQPAQEFAERQLRQASEAVERTVPGMTTREPDLLGAGLRAQRDVEGQIGGRATTAQREAETFIEGFNPTDLVTAGQTAAKDVRQGYRQFQAKKGPFFQHVEALAGDEPVVNPGSLRSVAADIATRTTETGLGGARGAGTLSTIGAKPASDIPNIPVGGTTLASLPPGPLRDQILAEFGIDLSEQAGPITFKQARQAQSRLYEMGFGRGRAVGTLNEGDARRMWSAISDDLDTFMTDPTTDPRLGTALAEAKQYYATNKQLFNQSVNKQVFSKGFQGKDFLNQVFRPGAIENTVDFKMAVDAPTYQQAVGSKLADLWDQAMDGGDFVPQKFVAAADKYLTSGHADVMLEPSQAERFREVVEGLRGVRRISDTEKLVSTKDPEQLVEKVFRPRALSDTVGFKSMVEPETFDEAVQEWARKTYQASITTKGGQTAGEPFLAPSTFVRQVKPLLNSGQLDVMFSDRPEVVAQFRELTDVFQRMGRAETLAGNPSGTGQTLLGHSQYYALLTSAATFLHGLATGNLGQAGAAVAGAASSLSPYALGKFTRSPTGIKMLTEGLEGPLARYSGPASRFAIRVLGQQASEGEQPNIDLTIRGK